LYLDNYLAQYRIRSTQALVAIGDPEATSAIQRALRTTERQDVRQQLQQALQELAQ
jgi:HEAT repeat protein